MARMLPPARTLLFALFVLVAQSGLAGAETLAEIADYPAEEMQAVGFELPRPVKVEVEAVGARYRGKDDLVVYAWILDAATRKTVWTQQNAKLERVSNSRVLRRAQQSLELAAGRYELYAWAGTQTPSTWSVGDGLFGGRGIVISRGPSDRDSREVRRALRDCYVRVQSAALAASDVSRFEPTGEIPGALFRATRLGDEASAQAAFRLDRAGELRLYCLGEIPTHADAFADGAWIVDTSTRKRVWEFRRRQTQHAGGADKNCLFDDTVKLEAGHYQVVVGTDGSHSDADWNSTPPDDPFNWGLTILPGAGFDPAAFHLEPGWTRGEPLVALQRMRDSESAEKRFRLSRDAELQIYAQGEAGGDWDELADRGWITDVANGRTVWEMTESNTVPAGGAEKNRMFDGLVSLPAGEYRLHFETDGSHSYADWNADAPFDEDGWGVAIYAGPSMRATDLALVEDAGSQRARGTSKSPAALGATLAELTEVGDDADVHAEFTLDGPGRIHIYALGEGLDREMYDYGWIENAATGRTVWEMTMRNTRHAGGARKNRVFDDEVQLDAGRYVVHFQTDGSHAYGDWNDRRPPDPHGWGITVTVVDEKRGTPER